MNYKYFPHTRSDLQAMFDKIGVKSLEDLYAEVPDSIRFKGDYELPEAMSELEVRRMFSDSARRTGSSHALPALEYTTTTHQPLYVKLCAVLNS